MVFTFIYISQSIYYLIFAEQRDQLHYDSDPFLAQYASHLTWVKTVYCLTWKPFQVEDQGNTLNEYDVSYNKPTENTFRNHGKGYKTMLCRDSDSLQL